ncbi:hypothetical protein [Promicromonospora soli]
MTLARARTLAAAAVAAAALGLATPAVALADAGTGAEFGQHVRECAQTMGFTGQHNPGMHHGYAGWDATDCDG